MWRVWKWGHFSVRSSDLRRLARRAEEETTAVGEVWRLLRVRELPLVDPATKDTNSSSEAMLRRGTGVSSWDGILDKTLPSTQVKTWSQNQLEERAKLEVDLLFGSGDRPSFSPLPQLLLCFRPCSLISRQPRFVWPTLSDPGTACLSPLPELPAALLSPAAAQAFPDPLAAATIWPLGSPSLGTILKDAGGKALAGAWRNLGVTRKPVPLPAPVLTLRS